MCIKYVNDAKLRQKKIYSLKTIDVPVIDAAILEAVDILLGDGEESVYMTIILFPAIVQGSGRIKPVRWRICIPGDRSC